MNNKFLAVIGLAIFLIILSNVEILKVVSIIYKANLEIIVIALIVFSIMLLLKGIKWKYILATQEVEIGTLKATKYFTIGFFFSSFTPGRIGDFVRAIYIAKKKTLTIGLASVFLDRLIDIGLLLIFALAGLLIIAKEKAELNLIDLIFIVGIITALFFLLIILLLKDNYMKALLRPFYLMFLPDNAKNFVSEKFNEFLLTIKKISTKKLEFIVAIFCGVIFWLLTIFFAQLLAQSINIKISYQEMLVLYSIIALADVVPITISGIGTREGITILFFSYLNFEAESAIAFSLLLFSISYLTTAFIGYLSLVTEPIDFNEWKKKLSTKAKKQK
ncbi:MAG: lysylphosphatidylglycerol synthase transmembrane domain-containing protein [Candidatus Diapherotrites archaeon]